MAEIAVSVALFFIDKVIDIKGGVRTDLHAEVSEIRDWLRTAQAYLKDMEGNESSAVLKERIHQIRDLAYDIEDVLDEYMLYVPHRIHKHKISNKAHGVLNGVRHWSSLHDLNAKIKDIKKKKENILPRDAVLALHAGINITSFEAGSSSSSSVEHHVTPQILEDDEIVGFEKPIEDLIRQLITREESSCRLTISVVGPAGSGKSMLVKSVYESKLVEALFDSRAWVHVSCCFKIENLICSILKQIAVPLVEEPNPREGVDMQDKLRSYLNQKRCVLVLDDIWSLDDWERIKSVLPNGSSGSRIIVTTRNSEVASCCVESTDFKHTLDYLPWTESWDLFCKKAFRREKCPKELVEWSQKILKKCEGIPLAIVAVGCLLSTKNQVPHEWKKLHDSLGSEIETHANLSKISRMLLPSYKDLPTNLKSCFLYFSIFPEDYSIKRGRLTRLWIAEGFVMKVRGKTPEEVAEDYLNQLIGRNLVDVTKRDFDGRARSCRVLNLVLELVVSKSEDENFVSILSEPNNSSSSSEKVRRLSIRNACATYLSHSTRFSCVRSTFFFRWDGLSPSEIGNVLPHFRLLRVLDLQEAPLEEFPQSVVHLSLLRYLSLSRTNIKTVPKSIKKLSHLETLDLKQTYVTKLPEKILRLQNLRNLLVYRYNVQNCVTSNSVEGVEMSAGIGGLTALQKLSLVKPDKHGEIIKELQALTQLRKLGLTELKRKDGKALCSSIQKMENLLTLDLSSATKNESLDLDHMSSTSHPLPQLQRLYLKGQLEKFPEWISSLHNLFRIALKWSGLQGTPLGALQDLPNLLELELVDVNSGNELVFGAGKFRKLKILHIEEFCQLHTVKIEEGAMPELQKLTLCRCVKLKILPLGINNLTHLKEFLLYDMDKDFIAQFQETSEDREMVSRIPVIHSFTLGSNQYWSLQNLSSNMESAMS